MRKLLPLAIAALAASVVPASAALLLYEDFDYTNGNINGQGGWATATTGNGGTANVGAGFSGFGTLATPGKSVTLINTATNASQQSEIFAGRANPGTTQTVLYASYLVNYKYSADASNSETRMNNTQTGVWSASTTRQLHRLNKNTRAALGSPTGGVANATHIGGLASTKQNTDLMTVLKYENSGADSIVSMWILEASDYNTITAGVINDAALDSNAYSYQSITFTGDANADFFQLGSYMGGGGAANSSVTKIGELRIATTLRESLAVVPEPSTTALLGLGGLALILRRRK